jgi:predicted TIM-barrel fold metal-dependent hydrolase
MEPPAGLGFDTAHYEPLWEACADAALPVSLHVLTGQGHVRQVFDLGPALVGLGVAAFSLSVGRRLAATLEAVTALVTSGVLDRHRALRMVVVENEAAWLPFFVDQLDYYHGRFSGKGPIALERPPSAALAEQVSVTFFRDPNVGAVARRLGPSSLMWSSDYPHANSTWPRSQEVVAERLAGLPTGVVEDITWRNCARLYRLDPSAWPAPVAAGHR